jgi:cadmium resistance protein CadD (predicted permease)
MALLGLAIMVFASTNIDDVFVLLGFFADPRFRPREVVIGQYAGITALFAASVIGSLLALVIPRAYVGVFGIVAIALGAKKLLYLYLDRNHDPKEMGPVRRDNPGSHARISTVAFVTVANGADNIGVYMPTFAVHAGYAIVVFALVFLVMTGLWCLFAHWLVRHPTLGTPIRRYSPRLTPIVLIGIGVLIMFEAGSFELLLRLGH